jgi:hypothetical protein
MKKLSTIKFYNILRSTTFVFAICSSKVILKILNFNFLEIQISFFGISNVVFFDKIILNKKVVNYKVL